MCSFHRPPPLIMQTWLCGDNIRLVVSACSEGTDDIYMMTAAIPLLGAAEL